MKITTIRNPVIRVVAKMIGTIFFAREETGSVSTDDLALIHYALPPSAHAIYRPEVAAVIPPTLTTNLGYQFARILYKRRARGLNVGRSGKDDYLGGLLAPIFRAVGIDLRDERTVDYTTAAFDTAYFTHAKILKRDASTYQFHDELDNPYWVKLPVEGLTSPDSPAALRFEVPPELLIDLRGDTRRARITRRPPPLSSPPPPPPPATQPPFPDPAAMMGAPVWEEVSDDITRGWPIFHRNMEKLFRWITCGGCPGGGSRGETSRTAYAADRAADADETHADDTADDIEQTHADEGADIHEAAAAPETAIVPHQPRVQERFSDQFSYRRRRRPTQFPPRSHSASSEDSPL